MPRQKDSTSVEFISRDEKTQLIIGCIGSGSWLKNQKTAQTWTVKCYDPQ